MLVCRDPVKIAVLNFVTSSRMKKTTYSQIERTNYRIKNDLKFDKFRNCCFSMSEAGEEDIRQDFDRYRTPLLHISGIEVTAGCNFRWVSVVIVSPLLHAM